MNLLFISSSPPDGSSLVHRCKMIGDELKNCYNINYTIVSERKKERSKGNQRFPSLKRYLEALVQKDVDVIIIHRSASFLTYCLLKIIKSKNLPIIYDYDDSLFESKSIAYSFIDHVIKESNVITAGSHYLLNYSRRFNRKVYLLPTPVHTKLFYSKGKKNFNDSNIVVGWLGDGTEYQLPYLRILKKPLKRLSQKYDIKFKIISALSNKVRSEFSNLSFKVDLGLDHWVPLENIPDLISDFDIGVMPLTNDNFSRGKCAMKALEYMSMEIPVIASAVGENNYVIKNGFNGFLASNEDDWVKYIEELILNDGLRKEMGKRGKKFVKERYSLEVVGMKMAGILEEART